MKIGWSFRFRNVPVSGPVIGLLVLVSAIILDPLVVLADSGMLPLNPGMTPRGEPLVNRAPVIPDVQTNQLAMMETETEKAFFLHLASLRSEVGAHEELERLRQKHEEVLAQLHLIIKRVTLVEEGVYYRVLAGPLLSRFEAKAYCAEIHSAGQNCAILPR